MYALKKAKWYKNQPFLGSNLGWTRSLEIEALSTALEVLERPGSAGSVLEDDAIFDLKAEWPSHRAISVVAWRESVSQICWLEGNLESAGPYLAMGLSTDHSIFEIQYRNKLQTKFF